jgi:hypothetical protein
MVEKLIELVRKCEELYDISNKKYSDGVWRGKLWGKIDGEWKISDKLQCSFIAHTEVTIIVLSPLLTNAGKCIPWKWYNMADNIQG